MVRELTVEEAHCQARQLHHLGATPAITTSSISRKAIARKQEGQVQPSGPKSVAAFDRQPWRMQQVSSSRLWLHSGMHGMRQVQREVQGFMPGQEQQPPCAFDEQWLMHHGSLQHMLCARPVCAVHAAPAAG